MIVVGIDPGVTTGLAAWNTTAQSVLFTAEDTDPIVITNTIYAELHTLRNEGIVVVVENFIGGGHRTAEANQTLQALGYYRYHLARASQPVILQVPQWRKAYVSRAAEILLPDYPDAHHSIDALAHCLCYEARHK